MGKPEFGRHVYRFVPINADSARKDSRLARNRRFTHRPILEASFLLQEGGKPEFTSEFLLKGCS
jgi:hypothetical protein